MDQHLREQMREHFADLSNEEVLGQLGNQKTIRILEETLGDDILPELNGLKARDLDLGEKLTADDVTKYFPGVKQSVDTLLDVDGSTPNVWIQTFSDKDYIKYLAQMTILGGGMMGYLGTAICTLDFTPSLEALAVGESIAMSLGALSTLFGSPNFYDPNKENISLVKSNVARARGVMAHEYVHRVQDVVGIPFGGKHTYLSEGMAENVRDIVGKDFEDADDSLRYENLRSRFHNMQNAYRLLAKSLGSKVKKDLIQRGQPWVQPFEKMYAYGTAFCHIQEREQGQDFYRKLTNRAKQQLATIPSR